MKKFVLMGVAGYIAPKHLKAIRETGNDLVAAFDPFDSVGILDTYFPKADFFVEFERFDRHIEKLKRLGSHIDFVTICSPNYLHDAHIRFGLRHGANVICEKPIVLNPWNIDALKDIENETKGRVFTILQLRLHPSVKALREYVEGEPKERRFLIELDYITSRGNWYKYSWKGDENKSGGIATNIGVHFFDMLIWIFGDVVSSEVHNYEKGRASGTLILQRADVSWNLSVEEEDLPVESKDAGRRTFRSLLIDGTSFEFSDGFTDLHTECYRDILTGNGFGLEDNRKAIEVVHDIRNWKDNSIMTAEAQMRANK